MKNIALYGGSFDPIHIGHLITAENIVSDLKIDELIFIPSNITPLKNNKLTANNEQRYEMIKRSIKNMKFSVSDYEINNTGISYTYFTVQHFKKQYPDANLYFIIGTDRVKDLCKWYEIKELAKLVTFIFVARDEEKIDEIVIKDSFYKELSYIIFKTPVIEISSTTIRDRVKNNKNINYLVTDECSNYIKEMKLYEF